jgi:CheY-like chemotaxis protein
MGESQAASSAFNERRGTARALRILVADDDHDTVDMLLFILRDEGHVVHGVYNGNEVLPTVRLFRPDAMFVDIAIPGMSGYAVARAVRSSFTDIRRPLMVAMSGFWKQTPDRMVAHEVGFDHHLVKPYDPAELLRLLEPLRQRNSPAGG